MGAIGVSSKRRGLFLDLDGTLANSLGSLKEAYEVFLSSFGKAGSDEEFESLNGPSLPEIVHRLKVVHGLVPSDRELLEQYRELLMESHGSAPANHGAAELLVSARECEWIVGLVTSSPRFFAINWLRTNGLEEWFDFLICGEDVVAAKPAPDPYRLATQSAQVEPLDSVAIEDSRAGVEAAAAAGIETWRLVVTPQTPGYESRQINSLHEAAALLRSCG